MLVLAEGPAGYAALARTISEAQLRGEKGAPELSFAQLAEAAADAPGLVHHHRVSQGRSCPPPSCATVPRPRSARSSS